MAKKEKRYKVRLKPSAKRGALGISLPGSTSMEKLGHVVSKTEGVVIMEAQRDMLLEQGKPVGLTEEDFDFEPVDEEPATQSAKRYVIRQKSPGWFDVVDTESDDVVNEKGLREDDAQSMADEMNEG